MNTKYFFIGVISLFLLSSCTAQEKPLDLKNPFIGGVSGIDVDFQNLRSEIYDGGRDPFEINVKLQNKGEFDVAASKVHVKLSGFNPAALGKLDEQLSKTPSEDLSGMKKDAQGTLINSPIVTVDFTELNHISPIVGATSELIVRADVCYNYKTIGVSKLCVRSNILNPAEGGICQINENKPFFSSSGPIQFENFIESTYGKDKLGFVFTIKKAGTGYVYEKDSGCDTTQRNKENRVYVKVDSKINGLSCTGLTSSGAIAQGFVSLFDGAQTITCKQTISSKNDFEQAISIEAVYDYDDLKQTTITVKNSGENTNSS